MGCSKVYSASIRLKVLVLTFAFYFCAVHWVYENQTSFYNNNLWRQPLEEFAHKQILTLRKVKTIMFFYLKRNKYCLQWCKFTFNNTTIKNLSVRIQVKKSDPDVIWTRNLLIWSQTRYRCATRPHVHNRIL